jgi:adenylate cyclase
MKLNSIRIKIISLIFFVLLLIVAVSLYISVDRQRSNLMEATRRTLFTNTEMLNKVIRNVMIKGEAPIAVDTMSGLGEIPEFKEIKIYRVDGTNAFNDFQTVDFVNTFQDRIVFPKTPRMDKTILSDANFQKVLATNSPIEFIDFDERKNIEYFYPILNNDERCKACHGDPSKQDVSFVRGIAHFTISVEAVFNRINRATLELTLFFAGIGAVFTVLLVFFMRGLIILPLNRIGKAVTEIGEGNLEVRVSIRNKDELGDLAAKINQMIKGLNERFHLSKYVSRSTEDLIVRGGRAITQSEKKNITVLFSDIRGFTAYAETQPPETVITDLNGILQVQAEIVEKYGGDIDKFVGDELMAVFEDEYTAVRCAYDLVKAVFALNKDRKKALHIGVGINDGEVIAGNIGSESRREYAVIGDTVNLASRLCGLARENMILISASVNERVKDRVETRLIANQKIKGKAAVIDVYAVKSLKA